MSVMPAVDARRTKLSGWGIFGRIVFVIAALPVLGFWGLLALLVDTFRCDESCYGNQAESWQWTGQAVLAGAGILIALVGLALSFSRYRTAFWTMLVTTFCVAVFWFMWGTTLGT